jgi:hypothetical protein
MKHDKNVFRRLRAPAAATAPETQKVATGMRRHTTSLRAIHARGVHARHTFSKKKKVEMNITYCYTYIRGARLVSRQTMQPAPSSGNGY